MQHSEEWKRWTKADGTPLTQKEFGLFIEDNAKDVLDPAGGDLLQMALNFSSLRQVTFNSGRRLQDGTVSFEFKEEEKRSEEHTSELQSLMRISYAVFCLKKKNITINNKAI